MVVVLSSTGSETGLFVEVIAATETQEKRTGIFKEGYLGIW